MRLMHSNMIGETHTARPPRGGLSEIRSGVLIRLRKQWRSLAPCAIQTNSLR